MSTDEREAREQARTHYADELGRALEAAAVQARAAEEAASLWANGLRQDDVDDERALDDPVYGAALDVYAEVHKLREQADQALADWQQARQDAALRSRPKG